MKKSQWKTSLSEDDKNKKGGRWTRIGSTEGHRFEWIADPEKPAIKENKKKIDLDKKIMSSTKK
jgi:hypothetical protein